MPQIYELIGERESNITALEILRDKHEGNYSLRIHFKDFLLIKNDLSDGPCFLSFQEIIVKEILLFFSLTIINGK